MLGYILMELYVDTYKLIKMQEKKLDISPFIYIILMIVTFALAL